MYLSDILALVRKDLHDEDSPYRWSDDELERHINHAVKDFSQAIPLKDKASITTDAGSREISLASLIDRIMVEAVEYPIGQFPINCPQFSLWGDILTILGEQVPDGSDCYVYYGRLHILDNLNESTIPRQHEDLVITGACGYAAIALSGHTINRVNIGSKGTPGEWAGWGKEKLAFFRKELERLGYRNEVRTSQLYVPYSPINSQTTDWGP